MPPRGRRPQRRPGGAGAVRVKKVSSDDEWDKVTERANGRAVVLHFMAAHVPSCQKSRQLLGMYSSLPQNRNLVFCECDVSEWQTLYAGLGTSTVPTFAVYVDGERLEHYSGGTSDQLVAFLKKYAHLKGRGRGGVPVGKIVAGAVLGVRVMKSIEEENTARNRTKDKGERARTGRGKSGGLVVGIKGVDDVSEEEKIVREAEEEAVEFGGYNDGEDEDEDEDAGFGEEDEGTFAYSDDDSDDDDEE